MLPKRDCTVMTNNTHQGSVSSQDCDAWHNRADQLTECNQPLKCAFRATEALHLSERAISANGRKQQVKMSSLTGYWLNHKQEEIAHLTPFPIWYSWHLFIEKTVSEMGSEHVKFTQSWSHLKYPESYLTREEERTAESRQEERHWAWFGFPCLWLHSSCISPASTAIVCVVIAAAVGGLSTAQHRGTGYSTKCDSRKPL